MILPEFNTSFFKIGFIDIKWYSLAYIVSIFLIWILMKKINKSLKTPLFEAKYFEDDAFFYSIVGVLLGGRLGYVLFYNFSYYLSNPMEIFFIWHGGMSFHGGLIGLIISSYFLTKKHSIDFVKYLDLLSVVGTIGLFLGRLGNFINLELYGRATNSIFGMIFPNTDGLPRHPTQLYEAFFEGIIIFSILYFLTTKKKTIEKRWLNSSIFLILYSVFRIFIEFFREPDIQLGLFFNFITMGQILSLPLLFIGIYQLIKIIKEK